MYSPTQQVIQPVNQMILTEKYLESSQCHDIRIFSQLRNSTRMVGNMTRITARADQITKLSAKYTHTLIFADIYLLVSQGQANIVKY